MVFRPEFIWVMSPIAVLADLRHLGFIKEVQMEGVPGEVMAVVFPVVALVGFLGLCGVIVAKGRWWVVPIMLAGVAGFFVVFTTEPSQSFQETTMFTVIEAGLNLALYGGLGAFVYGIAGRPRPGSWWERRNSPTSTT